MRRGNSDRSRYRWQRNDFKVASKSLSRRNLLSKFLIIPNSHKSITSADKRRRTNKGSNHLLLHCEKCFHIPSFFFFYDFTPCSCWQLLYRRAVADGDRSRGEIIIGVRTALVHIGVKVILQRVERLENIGKVREKGAYSFFPFRQQDAYGIGCTRVKGSSVPCLC